MNLAWSIFPVLPPMAKRSFHPWSVMLLGSSLCNTILSVYFWHNYFNPIKTMLFYNFSHINFFWKQSQWLGMVKDLTVRRKLGLVRLVGLCQSHPVLQANSVSCIEFACSTGCDWRSPPTAPGITGGPIRGHEICCNQLKTTSNSWCTWRTPPVTPGATGRVRPVVLSESAKSQLSKDC